MKTTIACLPCFVDDIAGAVLLLTPDESLRRRIMRESLRWLGSIEGFDRIPSYYITRLHRILKRVAGVEVPFAELREGCNRAGIAIATRLQKRLGETKDEYARFAALVRWAIAGNHLDFRTVGTGYGFPVDRIEAMLSAVTNEGLAIDQTPHIFEVCRDGGRHILYLADNVGEIALDALLVGELRRYGNEVVVAVKGGPITSDATLEDAQAVGLAAVADKIILTGPDTLGMPVDEEMSAELRRELSQADIIIGKGQANYYALSEITDEVRGQVACLFRTKCDVAAHSVGTAGRVNVATFVATGEKKCSVGLQ